MAFHDNIAQSKQHFLRAWNSHADTMSGMWHNLPQEDHQKLLDLQKEYKELIQKAADHVYDN